MCAVPGEMIFKPLAANYKARSSSTLGVNEG
jgi:hypothetical protein